MRINIGQEFVIGGFTHGSNGVDALIVGYYQAGKLIYATRVRAGLVPASRRELYDRLKPLIVKTCPFVNLPEATSGRWGQGLTAAKMESCILGKAQTRRQL
jgi:bifunctional non-homologous end joining protein LigD